MPTSCDLHYLRFHDDLHDGEERVCLLAGLDSLEPLVAVLVGLLQGHVEVVVRLFSCQILKVTQKYGL